MNRKLCLVLAGIMTMSTLAGCGISKKTGTSLDIKYNVDDYVTLCKYEGINVTVKGNYETNDAAVQSYLQQTIDSVAPYVKDDSKTTVAADSIVNADYVGKIDGKAFDGGSASGVNINVATNSDAIKGTGYIQGFSAGLVGHNVGESVDCPVTFPTDYGNKEMAGKQVVFTFKINFIGNKVDAASITDEYVAANTNSFGGATTKAELLTKVKEAQASYAKSNKEQDTRNAVIEQMKKKCKVKFPKDLVNRRMKEYEDRYVETYVGKKSKTTLKSYLKKTYNTTVAAFEKDVKKNIEDNLKTELIFEAVAKKENIKLDEKDFKSYVKNLMTQNNVQKEDALYKLFAPNAAGGKQYLEKMYKANKSVDYVVKKAKVTIKPAEATKTAQ